MEYIIAERLTSSEVLLSIINASEHTVERQKAHGLITDYIIRDNTKNYHLVDDKLEVK